jgi:hypothetical protein
MTVVIFQTKRIAVDALMDFLNALLESALMTDKFVMDTRTALMRLMNTDAPHAFQMDAIALIHSLLAIIQFVSKAFVFVTKLIRVGTRQMRQKVRVRVWRVQTTRTSVNGCENASLFLKFVTEDPNANSEMMKSYVQKSVKVLMYFVPMMVNA